MGGAVHQNQDCGREGRHGSVYASTYREAKAKLIAAAASNSPVQAEPAHSSQTDYSDQFGSVAT